MTSLRDGFLLLAGRLQKKKTKAKEKVGYALSPGRLRNIGNTLFKQKRRTVDKSKEENAFLSAVEKKNLNTSHPFRLFSFSRVIGHSLPNLERQAAPSVPRMFICCLFSRSTGAAASP